MERLEVIETLKHLPDTVEAETAGLSEDALRYRPGEGEWSIKEIAGHLRDMAEVWHKRLNVTDSMADPLFPAFDGEASIRDKDYQDEKLETIIAGMREWRGRTVDLLSDAVDWTRLGQHRELGRGSLKQWGEYMTRHEAGHVASIRALKEAQTSARMPG